MAACEEAADETLSPPPPENAAPDELVIATTSESFEPEIPCEDGVPLVPSVAPVIVVQGSDYDMGYQYAQQLIQIFGPWYLAKLQRDFTEEDLTALKAFQWYIKKYTPEFIDWFSGMAAGATDAGVELSYTQVLGEYCTLMSHTGAPAIPTYPGTEPAESQNEKLPPQCSGFAAWGSATKDGKLIAAVGQLQELVRQPKHGLNPGTVSPGDVNC
jgi:hypothetical protein